MQELGSLLDRTLEGLATGDQSRAAGTLVDDRRADRLGEIVGTGGSSAIDEAGAAHVAVHDLVAAKVDRVIGGELGVDALVELPVAGGTGVECLEAAVVLGELLLDDVGLDRDAEVVGLTGEVGGEMVILVLLEGVIAEIAPEDSRHAEFVGAAECCCDLDDLTGGVLAAEVDGRADGGCTHVIGLLDGAEEDLLMLVGVGEELVMVDLHQERDLVGVLPRHAPQDAVGGGHGVAAALDGELHDVLGIEVDRVGREAGSGRVLDALIDREDREVAGVGEAARSVQTLEVGQHAGIAVAADVDAVDEIRSGKVE